MTISAMFWSAGLGLMTIASNKTQALFLLKYIHYFGAIFIPAFFFHFVCTFLNLELKEKRIIVLNYTIAIILQLSNFTNTLATVAPKFTFRYYTEPRIFYPFYTLWFIFCIIYAHYLLLVNYKNSYGNRKEQIKYQFLATAFGFGGGATTFFYVFNIPIYPWGMYIVFLHAPIMAYAILKYRLMDIRIALTRAGIFAFVYTFVLGLPLFLGYKYHIWMQSTYLAIILASFGPLIYTHLRKQAEDVLLSQQRKYQKTLSQAAAGMVKIKDLKP